MLPVAAEGHAEGDRHQGTLKFEIVVPHDQADRVMLYEVYASPEAFETHWHGPAKQEANRDLEPLRVSVSFVRAAILWSEDASVDSLFHFGCHLLTRFGHRRFPKIIHWNSSGAFQGAKFDRYTAAL